MAIDVAALEITDAELAGISDPYDAALWLAAAGHRLAFFIAGCRLLE